jgi:CHASE2 domain-containing sensor protein
MQQRPPELINERILVVDVTQDDIASHQYPLEDATVAQLLKKLEQYKPRALGLDMHRGSRGTGRSDLISRFEKNQNFLIVYSSGSSDPNYAPPPELSEQQLRDQVGFSDLIVDGSNPKNASSRGDLVVGKQPSDTSRTVSRPKMEAIALRYALRTGLLYLTFTQLAVLLNTFFLLTRPPL